MAAPHLPTEIMDMILEFLFFCPKHPWSNPKRPCSQWHAPSELPRLLPLRLVNRAFHHRLTPILYHHITCMGYYRTDFMSELSRHNLARYVRVLRVEVSPNDLGGRMRRVIASLISVDKKLINYFEALRIYLSPILKGFRRVKELHINVTYKGIYEKDIPKNKLVGAALEETCKAVKGGHLKDLGELIVGLPYEGGYTNFFCDLDDERYQRLMRNTGRKIHTGTVRLYDREGKFTTISYF